MTIDEKRFAPAPLAAAPFDVPKASQTTLDNGLRVVVFENKRLPLVNYRLGFSFGDVNDPADSRGMTSAMASMLTEGTENYNSAQFADKVERLGASLHAAASGDFFTVAASALSLYSSSILELLAEVIQQATFPEAELDLYRRNTVEHLRFQRSQPPFLASEQAARLIYGEHPYSQIAPSPADVEKLDRDAMAEFRRKMLAPNNAILIAVGDVERDQFIAEVNERFCNWRQGSAPGDIFSAPPARSKRTLTIVDRPGSTQSNIVIANTAIERCSPDYFAVLVMNQVLGAGASSRVFMNLREEKGYTYGAYTRVEARKLTGGFEGTAEVRSSVTGDSLREFFYEFERIRETKASADEIADAKNFLTGVFPIRVETQEGLTNLLVNQFLYGLPDDYLQTYRANVEAVTDDQILDAARKYVRPDEAAIVIVGDASQMISQVESYADEIEVFDTNGAKKN